MNDGTFDVEALARSEVRAGLPAWQLLRLYLDPFSLFKNTSDGSLANRTEAMQYNRRHRRILLVYMLRWSLIGGLCAAGMAPLVALAAAEPVLVVPIVGLELGFCAGLFLALVSLGLYLALGLDG